MALRRIFAALTNDQSGISTAEFAIVGPSAMLMMIGGAYVSMLGFTAAGLRYSAHAAARCASINTTTCSNATTTQAYAASQFRNLSGNSATFTATSETCGNKVAGTVTYNFRAVNYRISIPLTASACFP